MTELREATDDDGPAMLSVHRAAIRGIEPDEYTSEGLDAWVAAQDDPSQYPFDDDSQYLAVAERAGRIAGFVGLDLEAGVLETLYVRPADAGAGLGSDLLAHGEAIAAEHGHEVLLTGASRNAVPFYERHGYEADGTVELDLPGASVGFVRMEKSLG